MQKSNTGIELKYVEQRHEGIEAWIRSNQDAWVRLDFLLEYFLFGNVDLCKEYKGILHDNNLAKQYYEALYSKVLSEKLKGVEFNSQIYLEWQKDNQSDVSKARNLLLEA